MKNNLYKLPFTLQQDDPFGKLAKEHPINRESLKFVFVLIPEFPIYALIPAIETLRICNIILKKFFFSWTMVSMGEQSVISSNGILINVDKILDESVLESDILFVVSGNKPQLCFDQKLAKILQRLNLNKQILGGIDTGTFALAYAQLLNEGESTLHWEAIPLFKEFFPDVRVKECLFCVHENCVTCAGGMATVDMMFHLIHSFLGGEIAEYVANGLVYNTWRDHTDDQRVHPFLGKKRAQVINGLVHNTWRDHSWDQRGHLEGESQNDPNLLWIRILHYMEDHIENPLPPQEIAEFFYMSRRSLERLFRKYAGDSYARCYLKLRLNSACNMLFYSDISIASIAYATGFTPSSFSRCFQKHFNVSPRAYRQANQTRRHNGPQPIFTGTVQ